MPKYPSSAQIRAARGLLGWTRSQLADKVGVSRQTIDLMENKGDARNHATREKVQDLLERHGVRFLDDDSEGGEGVRFEEPRKRSASPAPKAE